MHRVSIELWINEWKFGRTRNAVRTQASGECFHSYFEFSQTFTSVCINELGYKLEISIERPRQLSSIALESE